MIDGVSWRILADDLARAWADVAAGRPPRSTRSPTSFRTWSTAIAEATGSTPRPTTGTTVLATAGPRPRARGPLDPAVDTAATVRSHTVSLPAEVSTALLSTVPAAMHGGVNDVLLTALSGAGRWRADRGAATARAAVLQPGGPRPRGELLAGELDLSRTVGWFTAIYPVRLDPGPLRWDDVLAAGPRCGAAKSVKEQLRAVPADGLGYGVLRYLDRTRPTAGRPRRSCSTTSGRFAGGERAGLGRRGVGALREGRRPDQPRDGAGDQRARRGPAGRHRADGDAVLAGRPARRRPTSIALAELWIGGADRADPVRRRWPGTPRRTSRWSR